MAVQIGPRIGIEGEKEYRAQISQIIAQTKQLDSAMEATSAAWTQNTSAMTKNKAMAQNLTQQIGLYETKIAAMSQMLEESKAKFGENAVQTQKWQEAINHANSSLAIMKTQLQGLGNAASFSDLSTKIADMGTKIQNMGQSLTSVGTKLTMGLTMPIAAIGTAAVKLGSDLNESANKVDVVFGNMSQSVKDFAATSTEMYAISEGKALAMAGDYGAMATSMGMSQSQAASLATQMTALAGDMASFHNKSTEIAANSLKGVFTGETESLKQFGVAMTQTNLEDFAAKQGKVYDSMSQTEKIMTRYNYLLESQKDAIGDSGRTMGEFAGSTRQLKAALEDAGAALGEALIPIIKPMIQIITKLATAFANLPAPVQTVIAAMLLLVAAIGPVILIIGTLMSAFGAIVTNAPMVASAIIKIGSAILGMDVALAPAILAILGLVAAIAAAVAIGYLIGSNWDSIAEAASNMASGVGNAIEKFNKFRSVLAGVAKNLVSGFVEEIASLPRKIGEALSGAIQEIKDTFNQMIAKAKQSGKDFIQGFVDGIEEKIGKVVKAVKEVAETVKDFLGFSRPDKGPLHVYEEWMPHFMQGLAKGIEGNLSLVKGAVTDVAKTMELPLSSNAQMNMAMAGAGASGTMTLGGTVMNVYVDHISELNDLIQIQNQAQQRYRMGAQ